APPMFSYSWPLVQSSSTSGVPGRFASQAARASQAATPEPRSAPQVNQPDRGVDMTIALPPAPLLRAIRLKAPRLPPLPATVRVPVAPALIASISGAASSGPRVTTGLSNIGAAGGRLSDSALPEG